MLHFGKLELMSFIADDLSDVRKKQIQNHLRQCQSCTNYFNQLQMENQQFLNSFPDITVPDNDTYFQKSTKPRRLVDLFAIAAVLIFSVTGSLYLFNGHHNFRTKGSEKIRVFCKNEYGITELLPHSKCVPGDLLQFSYSSVQRSNFLLLSIDTTGKITTFFPSNSDSSIVITTGADIPLPHSILLDNYLGPELYLALFSSSPFEISNIVQCIESSFNKKHSIENIALSRGKEFLIQKFMILKEYPNK